MKDLSEGLRPNAEPVCLSSDPSGYFLKLVNDRTKSLSQQSTDEILDRNDSYIEGNILARRSANLQRAATRVFRLIFGAKPYLRNTELRRLQTTARATTRSFIATRTLLSRTAQENTDRVIRMHHDDGASVNESVKAFAQLWYGLPKVFSKSVWKKFRGFCRRLP